MDSLTIESIVGYIWLTAIIVPPIIAVLTYIFQREEPDEERASSLFWFVMGCWLLPIGIAFWVFIYSGRAVVYIRSRVHKKDDAVVE